MTKYLVKNPALYKAQLKHRLCETAAKVAVKYGHIRTDDYSLLNKYLEELWSYDDYPPNPRTYRHHLKCNIIKDYIYKYITVNHPIWNADFLNGLCTYGNIRNNKRMFSSFYWYYNESLAMVIKESPFGGNIRYYDSIKLYGWCNVPALSLQYQIDTMSYMAGVLATGQRHVYRNKTYIRYNGKVGNLLKEWGIPIEYESDEGLRILIAPIWPALFTKFMPSHIRETYLDIMNSEDSHLYAAILWYTYVGTYSRKDKMPYLQSRRTIFYKYKHQEGTLYRLEMMRVEKKMVELDLRIKRAVKIWATCK